jgi:aldose 1-epimerase
MNIEKKTFGNLPDGREVSRFILDNGRGMQLEVINYGAIIKNIRVPDRKRDSDDVALGFEDLQSYLGAHPYFGAMVGRYCNRIGKAGFELEGRSYQLSANEGKNQLHGGIEGFDRKLWEAEIRQDDEHPFLVLRYKSPDGEEGFPGNLVTEVEYSVNESNELIIECRATTDKPTHVNLTNHSYFNLNGCRGKILDHELFIDADRYTPLDGESIPTGQILPVENTPYDFRNAMPIGERIAQVEPGYDINYVLHHGPRELSRVAAVYDPESGRTMEVLTTLPGIQLYTSNHISGIQGKEGILYRKHCALCLETQFFPDSPNQQSFPSTVLLPGETYSAVTVYRFSA